MLPNYDLDKIKFATDESTFEKAVDIYESGGINDFMDDGMGFSARVRGSGDNVYDVSVSARYYDRGNCSCYLGRKNVLCKHMVVVAIRAVTGGEALSDEDKQQVSEVTCSGRVGELSKEELSIIKKEITGAIKYIKPYNGPSRIWFSYQNSLSEGCSRLSKIVSELPVSEQTAKLLIDLLLRLDNKLCRSGVDDSDGAVGGFMEEVVQMLKEYAELDLACVRAFRTLEGKKTCFGWDDPLWKIADECMEV